MRRCCVQYLRSGPRPRNNLEGTDKSEGRGISLTAPTPVEEHFWLKTLSGAALARKLRAGGRKRAAVQQRHTHINRCGGRRRGAWTRACCTDGALLAAARASAAQLTTVQVTVAVVTPPRARKVSSGAPPCRRRTRRSQQPQSRPARSRPPARTAAGSSGTGSPLRARATWRDALVSSAQAPGERARASRQTPSERRRSGARAPASAAPAWDRARARVAAATCTLDASLEALHARWARVSRALAPR